MSWATIDADIAARVLADHDNDVRSALEYAESMLETREAMVYRGVVQVLRSRMQPSPRVSA